MREDLKERRRNSMFIALLCRIKFIHVRNKELLKIIHIYIYILYFFPSI